MGHSQLIPKWVVALYVAYTGNYTCFGRFPKNSFLKSLLHIIAETQPQLMLTGPAMGYNNATGVPPVPPATNNFAPPGSMPSYSSYNM